MTPVRSRFEQVPDRSTQSCPGGAKVPDCVVGLRACLAVSIETDISRRLANRPPGRPGAQAIGDPADPATAPIKLVRATPVALCHAGRRLLSTPSTRTWQDYVEALGPPVYRACGQEPRPSFGSHGDPPVSVSLGFGDWGALLVVETSLQPIDDSRILVEMLMDTEPNYPLTIREENITVALDGIPTPFRKLGIEDRRWSVVAPVGDRWVYLRGLGTQADDVAIEKLGAD